MQNGIKIVITGMGVLSPLGIGCDPFWSSLIKGKCGIKEITLFPIQSDLYPCKIAAQVPTFLPHQYDQASINSSNSRFGMLALTALEMAIRDAGLFKQEEILHSAALFIGSAGQTGDAMEPLMAQWLQGDRPTIPSSTAFDIDPMAVINTASRAYGIKNKAVNISVSCSSGVLALMACAEYLRDGAFEIGIVVGADTISPYIFMGAALTGELSKRNNDPKHACRPFDQNQDGWVLGEGSVALVLETESHALAREARIYSELGPFAATTDGTAFKYIDESGRQMARGMTMVLDQVPAKSIDYVNAHGIGLEALDKAESAAIRKAFGNLADEIPVTSIKGAIACPSAAGGLLQVVSGILSIRDGIIPPTLNLEKPLVGCDLDYVKTGPRYCNISTVLVSAHGGGGINAAFTVHRYT